MTRLTEKQYKEWLEGKFLSSNSTAKKKSKYNAKKTYIDGHIFDSIKEASRYVELRMLEKAGKIKQLKLQPVFMLLDSFEYEGKRIRKITYIADFQYICMDSGQEIVEDVKGVKTQVYNIKKKLFLHQYGERFEFREV